MPFRREKPKKIGFMTKKAAVLLLMVVIVISLLVMMAVRAYADYKDTIITQQQQFLLEISKNAARSIELYIEDQKEDLAFLAGIAQREDYRSLLEDYYESNQKAIYGICIVNQEGEAVYQYPLFFESMSEDAIKESIGIPVIQKRNDDVSIGKVFKTSSGHYAFAMSRSIGSKGRNVQDIKDVREEGELVIIVNIEAMHSAIIEPIKTGVKGYTLVKDSMGTILMHPIEEQVGMDVIGGRRILYPWFDFSDLEKLIDRQLKGEEGYAFYKSYWWADEVPHQVEKLNGFAPANVGDDFWVVATTLDYKELDFPVTRMLRNLVAFVLVIASIFLVAVIMLVRAHRDRKNLVMELKYLEDLNAALEDLHKSKQQLSHYQQLRTIGTFTSGIAHEVNNFLTPILGYAEIMMQTFPKDSVDYEDAQSIYESAQKAREVIEQILIFSRSEKSLVSYKYKKIEKIVDKSIKMIEHFIPPNIKLLQENNLDGGYVYCSETQITQVLINLYTNGYQAIGTGNGTLSVKLDRVQRDKVAVLSQLPSENESFVRIVVEDTGCGIDEKNLSEIFSPFFTTKDVGEGTGLGLSVAHGIVLNHKGQITVTSRIGEGSVFTVYLPYFETAERAFPPPARSKRNSHKLNILIADDDKKIGNMLKRGLSGGQYTVDVYTNSVTVSEIFDGSPNKYDFIVTDYVMPQLNGVQLSRIVKQRYPDKKVILMSGGVADDFERYKKENLIDGYLLKPFTSQELSSKIEEIYEAAEGEE